jgi:hypothetical protein
MNNSSSLYTAAELAFAAYADLTRGSTVDDLARLRQSQFTNKQAEEFAKRYPEITLQFNDAETRVSATIFKDPSGNLTLATGGGPAEAVTYTGLSNEIDRNEVSHGL